MVKGLYTAYTGMVNEQRRMDIATNNLANANSAGFKEQRSVSQSFDDLLGIKIKDLSDAPYTKRNLGIITAGVKLGGTYTNFEQGALKETGNTFDLAINNSIPTTDSNSVRDNMLAGGNGFFATEYGTDEEQNILIKYTRDGNFTVTPDGYLVTSEGNYVLDVNNNRIQINPDLDTAIQPNGNILQDGNQVAQIQVASFDDITLLERYQDNAFIIGDSGATVIGTTAEAAGAQVHQGYLEGSNISVVDEMVNLISIQRAYELNSKVIQTEDDTLDKAVNQLGQM
ncbi:MAG: flagellar hook-basal body protein [Butyrivibrio sp.]|nr:flagellar hook-basal body protein [Butyrivibrio sp.]